ncbi:MAG: hypothetical protein ACI96P_001005 [Candidatus Azotimanducaceae bacterium]|jgi:hypothetical protein
MYRLQDSGKSGTKIGLEGIARINQIARHPTNSHVV